MAGKINTKKASDQKPEPKLHYIQHVIKGDTYTVLAQSGLEPEDEFGSLYAVQNEGAKTILKPPFDAKVLLNFVYTNNILSQCVDAMEVNIDGTGHEFVPAEDADSDAEAKVDKTEETRLRDFFNEPYPQHSLVMIRRAVRRDMEAVGYGFIEILRNMAGELVGLRHVPAYMIRLVKLDAPVQVTKKLRRDGKEVEMTVWERERRFVQRVGGKHMRYFKEYGATRNLHVDTGEWEGDARTDVGRTGNGQKPDGEKVVVPKEKYATELKMFGINPDVSTPYSVPRWINQLPSVIGSRKAEEHNLEFFDAGGIPPAIIFIQGGTLASDMSKQLKMYLSGQNKSRNRAVVVEAQANSGSMDSVGTVQVKVERFGSERANDAMFMEYDDKCEQHVRTGFRLPPMFLGKNEDYNFATAQTAYMVAEAQVFGPERDAFDEWINRSLVRELKCEKTLFKSKPITLTNVEMQLKAMELVAQTASGETLVAEVNKIADLTLEYQEPEDPAAADAREIDKLRKTKEIESEFAPEEKPERIKLPKDQKIVEFPQGGKARTIKHDPMELLDLVQGYLLAEGFIVLEHVEEQDAAEKARITKAVNELKGGDREVFKQMLSMRLFGVENLIELCEHQHGDAVEA